MVALKLAGGALVLMRAEDVAPGDIVNFLLTAALYKAKAHGKACPLALGGRREGRAARVMGLRHPKRRGGGGSLSSGPLAWALTPSVTRFFPGLFICSFTEAPASAGVGHRPCLVTTGLP